MKISIESKMREKNSFRIPCERFLTWENKYIQTRLGICTRDGNEYWLRDDDNDDNDDKNNGVEAKASGKKKRKFFFPSKTITCSHKIEGPAHISVKGNEARIKVL